METFGSRLRQLLEEKEIQNKDFAKFLRVAPSTISNWLNGDRFPNDEKMLTIIANYFNVTLDYLLGKSDIRQIENKDDADLSKRDLRQIEKDLEKMMEGIKSNPDEGFSNYDGNSNIDEDDLALLEDAFRTALRVVKKLNKETYTPKKYKKD